MKFGSILIVIVVALGVLGASSLYIVNEKEQALVLEFGKIKAVVREPGLKFKLPFINTVTRFDDRILSLETSDLEVTPLDNRRLTVNAFARYRITDPRKFYQAVRQQGQERSRLAKILNGT